MTEPIWGPYHMGIMEPSTGDWNPMCGSPRRGASTAIVYEFWRFIELSENNEYGTMVCEDCKNHPDFIWHHLGSL